MYKTAQKFKRKEDRIKQQIREKEAKILQLKSHKRKQQKENITNLTLTTYIEYKKIKAGVEIFCKEFENISESIKSFVETSISKYSFEWEAPDLNAIIATEPDTLLSEKSATEALESEALESEELESEELESEELEPEKAELEKIEPENFEPEQLVEDIKEIALLSSLSIKTDDDSNNTKALSDLEEDQDNTLTRYIELTVSDDSIKAWLQKKREEDKEVVNLASVLDFLRVHQISYGIIDDEIIEQWIEKPYGKNEQNKIEIATGKAPVPGQEGKISYSFKTDYTNPGKILKDGSIDFRERGDVPFVKKGDLLATLQSSIEGVSGINLSGEAVGVDEVIDPLFSSDSGTTLLADGLKIIADVDGQPNVDAMGNVTVSEELVINENVDFKTGNVNFAGNIIVKGIIKEGFAVKGVNLTARAIEGANIELSGDLNVSEGITNTEVRAVGNIYTKFINNCKIYGFGDFVVQKEIIDSSMLLSGSCIISSGHVIGSKISAKQGIEAKNIGTHASTPPDLRVGLDDHIGLLEKKIQESIEESLSKRGQLKEKIKELNKKDQELHKKISDYAYAQDRSQLELKKYQNKLEEYEKSKNIKAVQEADMMIFELKKVTSIAEAKLNSLFELQDKRGISIDLLNDKIQVIEEKNVLFMKEKKHLQKVKKAAAPDPTVSISNTVVQGTKVQGPNSFITLKNDEVRCKIHETKETDGMMQYFAMSVSSL